MASARLFAKLEKKPKFKVRHRNRCRRAVARGATTASSSSADLPAAARAAGRDPRRHQVELVGRRTMTTDPISDMLTRIRNALLARHDARRDAALQAQGAHRRDPQARGLHRRRSRCRRGRAGTLTVVLKYGRDQQQRDRRHAPAQPPRPSRVRRPQRPAQGA